MKNFLNTMIYINNPYLHPKKLLENIIELLQKEKKKSKKSQDPRGSLLFQVQNSIITNLLNQPRASDMTEMQERRDLLLSESSEEAKLLQQYPELYRIVRELFKLDAGVESDSTCLIEVITQLQKHDEKDPKIQDKALTYWKKLTKSYSTFKDCGDTSMSFTLFKELAQRFDVLANLIEKNCVEEKQPYLYAMMSLMLLTKPNRERASAEKVEKELSVVSKVLYELASIDGRKGQPYHDLFLAHLSLDGWVKLKHPEHWRKLIQKESQKNQLIFEMIAAAQQLENYYEKEKKALPSSKKEVKLALAQLRYARYSEDPEFADICYKHKVPETTFNKSLNYLQQGPWPRKEDDLLPKESISYQYNNAETPQKEKEFVWVKMPVTDKRALILGAITDCCQSIVGDSEQCVKDAVSLEHNGLYVLLEKKKDGGPVIIDGQINEKSYKIIGQSYAWMSRLGNLCLDSIECLKDAIADETLKQLLQQWAVQLLERHPNIRFVTVGTGGKTPESWSNSLAHARIPESMAEGKFYMDASSQYIIRGAKLEGIDEEALLRSDMCDEETYLKYYASPELIAELQGLANSKSPTINFLTPVSVSLFLNVMMNQGAIPVSLENYQALRSKEQFERFLFENVEMLTEDDLIKSLEVFGKTEDRRQFFTKVRPRLFSFFQRSGDFLDPEMVLSAEEKIQIYDDIMQREDPGFFITNADTFYRVMQFIPTQDHKDNFYEEMMKDGRLISLIEDAESFANIMKFLDEDQRLKVSEEIMKGERLASWIEDAESFTYIMEVLDEDQRVEVYQELMKEGRLISLIVTLDDFRDIVYFLDKDQRVEVSEALMKRERFASWIVTPKDLRDVLEILEEEQKSELYKSIMKDGRLVFFLDSSEDFTNLIDAIGEDWGWQFCKEVMKDGKLISLIETRDCFNQMHHYINKIMEALPVEEKEQLYREILFNGRFDSIGSFKAIIELFTDRDKRQLYALMMSEEKNLLSRESDSDFDCIEDVLMTQNNARIYESVIKEQRLSLLINNVNALVALPYCRNDNEQVRYADFNKMMEALSSEEKEQFYREVVLKKDKLNAIQSFVTVIGLLADRDKAELYKLIMNENKLLLWIKSVYDFSNVAKLMPSQDKTQLYEIMMRNEVLVSFITSTNHFKIVMDALSDSDKKQFYNLMLSEGKLLSLIGNIYEFTHILNYLESEEKAQFYNAVIKENKLIFLIDSIGSFWGLMNTVNATDKAKIYEILKTDGKEKLLSLIKSPYDFISSREFLTPDDKIDFYNLVMKTGRLVLLVEKFEDFEGIMNTLSIEEKEHFFESMLRSGRFYSISALQDPSIQKRFEKFVTSLGESTTQLIVLTKELQEIIQVRGQLALEFDEMPIKNSFLSMFSQKNDKKNRNPPGVGS